MTPGEGNAVEQEDRDLLIRLDQKMDDVRESMGKIEKNDGAQWKKIDEHTEKLAAHAGSLHWLTWGFRLIIGSIIAAVVWVFKH